MRNPERSIEKISGEKEEERRRIREDLTPEEEKSFQEIEEKLVAVTERIKKLRAFESTSLLSEIRGFTYSDEKYIPPEIQNVMDKKKAELQEEFNQLAGEFATIRDPKNIEKVDAIKKEIENI